MHDEISSCTLLVEVDKHKLALTAHRHFGARLVTPNYAKPRRAIKSSYDKQKAFLLTSTNLKSPSDPTPVQETTSTLPHTPEDLHSSIVYAPHQQYDDM